MTTALAKTSPTALATTDYTREKIELIKQTVAQGCSDVELELFLYTAKRTGLDPLLKQVYAIKRWNSQANKETMTIQTGIDGYRLIADRTSKLAGIADAVFDTEDAEHPNKATVTVTKIVEGAKAEFSASARWQEYCQTKKDGKPTAMWSKMPYLMLGKCAEALALRKAFPADLSGVYTFEEMSQSENETAPKSPIPEGAVKEAEEISGILRLQETDKTGEGREYYRFEIGEKQVCAFFDSPVVSRLIDQQKKQVTVKAWPKGNVWELAEVISVEKVTRKAVEAPKPEPKPVATPEEPSPTLDLENLPAGFKHGIVTIDKFKAMKSKTNPPRPYLIVTIKDEKARPYDLFCWDTKVQSAATKALHKMVHVAFTTKAVGEDTKYTLEGFIAVEGVPTDKYGVPVPDGTEITEEDIAGFGGGE